jgi:hypothetical protein
MFRFINLTAAKPVTAAVAAAVFALTALVSTAQPAHAAGVPGGPLTRYGVVSAHSSIAYDIYFRGNELAEVVAMADGDDVDLYVYDENGNLIDSDTLRDDMPICSWTPRWTGKFRIVVKNCEGYAVPFAIVTN